MRQVSEDFIVKFMMTLTHWSIQHVENMHHTQERKKHSREEETKKVQQKQDTLEIKGQ